MSFNNIVGQEAAVRILQDELKDGRVQHAYLFSGKRGVGKKALALELTKAIFCSEKEIDSCDNCLACRKIIHSNHPDTGIYSIEKGNFIKIDQIRKLQKDIAYKPYESGKKIYIIENADKMTTEAANSLLRTLEEPPGYAIIILLAEEVDRLLPTIISRCQQIQLKGIADNTIKQELIKEGIEEKQAALLTRLADGSLGIA
ncbi:MAG: DNA polymerase III subunit delta', partial [Halanaerobiaceae bacterium]